MMKDIRIGYGYDVHRLVEGLPLILGGVTIPYKKGLAGHSDADVLLHAICDALLGAAALGDIGQHFPDHEESFKDIDSLVLLRRCWELLEEEGYSISNVDATVVAQQPRLASHIQEMCQIIGKVLGLDRDRISVKATTSEKLGFEGKGEGISASAIALVYKE